jgi:hypothetical protein
MAGRVSVADSVARVALVTMEEAEQLDIEFELEQRATLGARAKMVEAALNTLQQFVAVTKQAVADALVSRSAPPRASSDPVPGAASGTPTSPAVTPDTGATAASIRRGRSFSRGRNKMSGKWGDLAEENDTEEILMQGTRGRDDARGSTDVDVAETPVIIALPDIAIQDTPVFADMPVILGTTSSTGTSDVNLATLGVPSKRMPAELAQTFKSPPAKAVQQATLAVRDVPARGTVALSLPHCHRWCQRSRRPRLPTCCVARRLAPLLHLYWCLRLPRHPCSCGWIRKSWRPEPRTSCHVARLAGWQWCMALRVRQAWHATPPQSTGQTVVLLAGRS